MRRVPEGFPREVTLHLKRRQNTHTHTQTKNNPGGQSSINKGKEAD